jgi:molybdopterin/thiamine biosynthesis adenylyltransferase
MPLTPEQLERFSRQIRLPEIGRSGQERLMAGRVLIVGAGGLGSAAAYYLCAGGVGTIGIADGDRVELSNLQRQILHGTADIGRLKVESAAEKLQALWPAVKIEPLPVRLGPHNIRGHCATYDFIIDATDDLASKFRIADACHFERKPYSHAGILKYLGQTMTVNPGTTACYRCIFSDAPEDAAASHPEGPLGVVPGVIGTIQAAEAIWFLLGAGVRLTNRLMTFDAMTLTFRSIAIKRNPNCPLCGDRPRILKLV